jgi:uracil-DNA glycosylase
LHGPSGPKNLFVSYRDPCRDEVPEGSTLAARVNAVFDAELRAVTAHVLLPVGPRAIEAVLDAYTPVDPRARAIRSRHAREIATGSWVVLPIADPETWTESDEQSVRSALEAILDRDYRREADLGRHLTGPAPYFVR